MGLIGFLDDYIKVFKKDKNFMETWKNNHKGIAVTGSLTEGETKKFFLLRRGGF